MVKDPTELIHCDACGEDYAAAYRRCPFCGAKAGKKAPKAPVYDEYEAEFWDEEGDELPEEVPVTFEPDPYASSHGGKRLATNRRGGGYGGGVSVGRIVAYILTALIVAAAVWTVVTQVLPRLLPVSSPDPSPTPPVSALDPSLSPTPTPTPTPSSTPEATPSPSDSAYSEPLPVVSGMPSAEAPEPSPSQSAAAQTPVSQAPAASAAPSASPSGSLKLSSVDFTLSQRYPTYQMEIEGVGRAQATYVISDESIAAVSSTGNIKALKNGVTKLTVTANDGRSATAIVRVSGFAAEETQTPTESSAPAASSAPEETEEGAKLSSTDFTLSSANGSSYRLRVSGGTAAYWTSSDVGVATVSSNGTVTAVGRGTARITCALTDGSILKCIVRVS